MSEHFINLNCANCGAKLNVYDDMQRFACGYCGTEMVVQRRGGTVALKAVTEAIQKVQIGTDKTAAELALVRLRQDRGEIVTQFSAVKPASALPWGCSFTLTLVFFGLGLWASNGGWGFFGLVLIVLSAFPLIFNSVEKEKESDWLKSKAEFDSKVASIDQEIARQIEIVSGSTKS